MWYSTTHSNLLNHVSISSVIFCESTTIYGDNVPIILSNKVKRPEEAAIYLDEDWDYHGFYYAWYGMFSFQ